MSDESKADKFKRYLSDKTVPGDADISENEKEEALKDLAEKIAPKGVKVVGAIICNISSHLVKLSPEMACAIQALVQMDRVDEFLPEVCRDDLRRLNDEIEKGGGV